MNDRIQELCDKLADIKYINQQVQDELYHIQHELEEQAIIKIAESFMSMMEDYQKKQQNDPDFDVNAGLYDLYSDLTNLYNDNA